MCLLYQPCAFVILTLFLEVWCTTAVKLCRRSQPIRLRLAKLRKCLPVLCAISDGHNLIVGGLWVCPLRLRLVYHSWIVCFD